jgi:hypothetical protein
MDWGNFGEEYFQKELVVAFSRGCSVTEDRLCPRYERGFSRRARWSRDSGRTPVDRIRLVGLDNDRRRDIVGDRRRSIDGDNQRR